MKSSSPRLQLFCLSLAFIAPCAAAQVTVTDAWVRATVPQQQGTGAFMQITSASDARLVGVQTPIAKTAEVHEMTMVDNVMRMRPLKALDLPAGKTVELKPNGYHVMLTGLKEQVKDGDRVALTLTVEDKDKKRQTIEIQAPVRPLNYMPDGGASKHKHH
jgi:copper(I)-binding protein